MNIINTLNDKRFTLNGIQYFKNYVSVVHGNKIEVFNCYERKDVLIELAHYNQFTVNGTVYSSASQLQEALLPVLYSRINMGDGSTFAQNNIGRTINIGFYMGDASIATIVSMMNNRTTTISSTDTPVVLSLISLPASLGNSQVTNKKYSYLFKPGEGVYGIGGTTVTSSMIFQLASLNLTPEDIQNTPGAIIYNLDPVSDGDYINKANETTWDFTDSGEINEDGTFTTYYFSYTLEDVLYFAQFKGSPGVYGVGNTPFEEEDFASTTNSNITPEKTKLSEFINDVPFASVAEVNGLDIIINQAAAELYLKNSEGTTLATVNLGFLNNEGTTFFYNSITKNLELKNDAGEVLSTVPVSAFVSNLIQSVNFNAATPSILEFKDSTGTVVTSVTFTINNISGLQTALDLKAPLASPAFTGTPTAPNSLGTDRSTKIATTHFVKSVLENTIKACIYQTGGVGSVINLTESNFTNSHGVVCDRLEIYISNSSNSTINLPDVYTVGFQREIVVVKRLNNAFTITITPPAGSTINGQSSYVLVSQFDRAVVVSDGTNYFLTSFKDKDLISQTITDGVTDSAPSQDAVYDNFRKYQVIAELNLDNVFETGSFLTQGSGVTGLPSGWAQGRHMLSVIGAIGQVYATQIITSITTGRIAFRRYSNPSWFGWIEFATTSDIALKADIATTLTQGANMPTGADLNTYTTTGLFSQITAANATIELNYPTTEIGQLEVVRGASNQIYQKYHAILSNDVWIRRMVGTSWALWRRLVKHTDLDLKADKTTTFPTTYLAPITSATPTAGSSMNDLPFGTYSAFLSTTMTSKPHSDVGAFLSIGSNTIGAQLSIGREDAEGNFYMRSYNGSYGNWKKIITSLDWATKQDALISGTNIKTVSGVSLLGSGDVYAGGNTLNYIRADGTSQNFANSVQNSTTGTMAPSNSPILTGDSFKTAVNKTQGQINALAMSTRPYKVYTAIMHQSGTSAPVATILENNLGSTVTWLYNTVGKYIAEVSGGIYTDNKCVCFTSWNRGSSGPYYSGYQFQSTNSMLLEVSNTSNMNTDGVFRGMIEIRVYN